MVEDYKVRRRYADELKTSADSWRLKFFDERTCPHNFSVTDCVRLLTRNNWIRSRDTKLYARLELKFIRQRRGEPPAYVDHNPSILACDKEIWDEADSGYPSARFIVAHEIAHVVLHDDYAQPFTSELKKAIWQIEESGEWQANTWAAYFLVSDASIAKFITPGDIATHCAVESDIVMRRLGPNFKFSGESCPECGSCATVRSGIRLKCDACRMIACA